MRELIVKVSMLENGVLDRVGLLVFFAKRNFFRNHNKRKLKIAEDEITKSYGYYSIDGYYSVGAGVV
jgi:hypothetical protein